MSLTTTSLWGAPAKNVLAKVRRRRLLNEGQRLQPCWPSPEKSIGTFEAELESQCCWQVIGPARKAWEKIHPEIKRYLEAHTEPISATTVLWIFRMIGHTPQTSSPTVIFCCEEKLHRKAAWKAIKESNILDDYPGIRLAHLPRVPCSKSALVPMWSSLGSQHNALEWEDRHTPSGEQNYVHTPLSNLSRSEDGNGRLIMAHSDVIDVIPAKPAYNTCVYGFTESVAPGHSVLVHAPHEVGPVRKATVGGFIEIAGVSCGMTAAHPFAGGQHTMIPVMEPYQKLAFSDSDECEDEVDYEMDTDTESYTRHGLDLQSQKNSDPANCSETWNAADSTPYMTQLQPLEMKEKSAEYLDSQSLSYDQQPVGRLLFSSIVEDTRPELDYALLLLKQPQVPRRLETATTMDHFDHMDLPPFTTKEDLRHIENTSVRSITASSTMDVFGNIDFTATFIRPPHASQYQEVYLVSFDQVLAQGDCGSWVYGSDSDALHGHIIAGSPDDGIAYIVPAYQVFDDLRRFFTADKQQQYLAPAVPSLVDVEPEFKHLLQAPDTDFESEHASSSYQTTSTHPPLTENAMNSFNQQHTPITMMDTWFNSMRPRRVRRHGK
jgi:hypothetical protein